MRQLEKGDRVRIEGYSDRIFVVDTLGIDNAYLIAEDKRSGGWHNIKTLILVGTPEEEAENLVVEAYRKALRLRIRKIHLESKDILETNAEQDERLDAICAFNMAELTYMGDNA